MRLESIKLAGFKSFVDPTTVAFPSNLTAIVGPNGCGKSNIIDAIRWVMGESSAKQLRGQSLDDVIFNGCKTRQALGKASIELNFDNSDGKLGGQYSSYTQIAIRREMTREGQSIYSLNGTRCRRRDIRDIFLGTGLGPRSYAIIEQGMISRIVEAKPDELRAYIEEAAGISKYKERRRETELRLEHTQENLNRLNDLREELSKQLKHLQRQANTAERYKILKQEERLLKAQLQALRYQLLDEQLQSQLTQIAVAEEHVKESQFEQQNLLKQITANRTQQTQARLRQLQQLGRHLALQHACGQRGPVGQPHRRGRQHPPIRPHLGRRQIGLHRGHPKRWPLPTLGIQPQPFAALDARHPALAHLRHASGQHQPRLV